MNELRAPSYTERADFYDLEYAARLGKLLPVASAKAFEKVLPFNPDDIVSRARVLGHYWKYYGDGATLPNEADGIAGTYCFEELLANRTEQILWFVRNSPDCIFAGDYYLSCDPIKDEHNYNRVKSAWQAQITKQPECAQTRVNYALFLFQHEKPSAKGILLEVLKAEPLNEWALSLLPLLGFNNVLPLPLPVLLAEQAKDDQFVDQRIHAAQRMVSRGASLSSIPRATVATEEQILLADPFDVWARLDILRWCQKNLDRANHLGFDPSVAQVWFRHMLWMLANAPHIDLDFKSDRFGFSAKVHAPFMEPMRKAFLDAIKQSPSKVQIIKHALNFFKVNVGLEETKKLLFPLPEWRSIDRKSRQQLIRQLNCPYKVKTIFEQQIDLDAVSRSVDASIDGPPMVPTDFSTWADNLDLGKAEYEGWTYEAYGIANLERVLSSYKQDIVSTARLASCYRRLYASLTETQNALLDLISKWTVENMPASEFAGSSTSGLAETDSGVPRIVALWKKAIERMPQNSRVALSAICSLAHSHQSVAQEIANCVLQYDPQNVEALAFSYEISVDLQSRQMLAFLDTSFEAICERRIGAFTDKVDPSLAEMCDKMDFHLYADLYSLQIPRETIWTNEHVLKFNPNDLVLRAELLGWCDRNYMQRTIFALYSPDISRKKTEHALWLLENAPHADLYILTRVHDAERKPSHRKILDKAIKKQRKVHGKTVAKYRPQFPHKKKLAKNGYEKVTKDEKANEEDFEN